MTIFKVTSEDGKSYSLYSEEGGKFYVLNASWWAKGGYCVPRTKKRISEKSYRIMYDKYYKEGAIR